MTRRIARVLALTALLLGVVIISAPAASARHHGCVYRDTPTADVSVDTGPQIVCSGSMEGTGGGAGGGVAGTGAGTLAATRIDAGAGGVALLAQVSPDDCVDVDTGSAEPDGSSDSGGSLAPDTATAETSGSASSGATTTSGGFTVCRGSVVDAGGVAGIGGTGADVLPATRIDAGAGGMSAAGSGPTPLLATAAGAAALALLRRVRRRR